jgi:hypothetical protein
MTIQEMHIRFKLGLDKVDSFQLPNMLTEEIDLILNINIEQFVRTRYGLNNVYREGFEGIEKRRADLRSLVVTNYITTGINKVYTGLYTYQLPDNFWFMLREQIGLTGTFCGKQVGNPNDVTSFKSVGVNPTKLDEIQERLDDPFSRPTKSKVLSTIENNLYTVYTDGSDVGLITMSYLKRPATVSLEDNIDCDLAEHTHQEIVEQAVSWTLESIESGRFQTQITQVNKTE